MTADLDERIRQLVARIDEMAPEPPLLNSPRVRTIGDRSAGSGVRRMLVPLVAATMVMTVVALTMLRRSDSTASPQLTLQSVSIGLPEGWTAIGGATSSRDPSSPTLRGDGVAYATSALPAGPVVVISPTDMSRLDLAQPSSTSTLPDGRRVVIGTSIASNLAADVEIEAGHWVGVEAVGIEPDTLLELAGRLSLGVDGARFDGALPDGMELMSTTFGLTADPPLAYSPYIDPSAWPSGLSITTYGPNGEAPSSWISIFPATVESNAILAITRRPTPLSDGTFAAVEEGRNGVYRLVDGLAVWATSDTLDTDALVELVDGLRPVDDDEWTDLVAGGTKVEAGTGGTDTTVAEGPVTTPLPPNPVSDAAAEVRLVYDLTLTSDGSEATATTPDGSTVRVTMRSVGRLLRTTVTFADTELGTFDLDLNRQPGSGGGASAGVGSGDGPYLFLVTDSNPARYAELARRRRPNDLSNRVRRSRRRRCEDRHRRRTAAERSQRGTQRDHHRRRWRCDWLVRPPEREGIQHHTCVTRITGGRGRVM